MVDHRGDVIEQLHQTLGKCSVLDLDADLIERGVERNSGDHAEFVSGDRVNDIPRWVANDSRQLLDLGFDARVCVVDRVRMDGDDRRFLATDRDRPDVIVDVCAHDVRTGSV